MSFLTLHLDLISCNHCYSCTWKMASAMLASLSIPLRCSWETWTSLPCSPRAPLPAQPYWQEKALLNATEPVTNILVNKMGKPDVRKVPHRLRKTEKMEPPPKCSRMSHAIVSEITWTWKLTLDISKEASNNGLEQKTKSLSSDEILGWDWK